MKSIFVQDHKDELLKRLNTLSLETQPNWGKMNVSQMLWHCQFPLMLAIKNKDYNKFPNVFARLLFKKAMYNDKPWRKNLPTTKAAKAIVEKDFPVEKRLLEQLIHDMHLTKSRTSWNPHPLFGTFTHEQWGKMQYKHLDHHLQQFGV